MHENLRTLPKLHCPPPAVLAPSLIASVPVGKWPSTSLGAMALMSSSPAKQVCVTGSSFVVKRPGTTCVRLALLSMCCTTATGLGASAV